MNKIISHEVNSINGYIWLTADKDIIKAITEEAEMLEDCYFMNGNKDDEEEATSLIQRLITPAAEGKDTVICTLYGSSRELLLQILLVLALKEDKNAKTYWKLYSEAI